MMKASALCDLLHIQYPIMQGGMQWLATPSLAAAVSNAGGLGTINASLSENRQELIALIQRTRQLTDRPFALNISMLPHLAAGDRTDEFMEVAIQQQVPVIETSGRSPADYVPALHQAGCKVVHKVASVKHALKAEAAGVDAISMIGFEAGGHPGMDYVGTFVLLPSIVAAVKIPVLAGGGICDGKSYLAARALGASGVIMGTRFLACKECPLHENFKNVILQATEKDTFLVQKTIKNACRVWKNQACTKLYELEAHGNPTLQDVLYVVNGRRQRQCYESGDVQSGSFPVGQCVGRIHSILSAKEIIEEIVRDAEAQLKALL
ncbi:NAD(P)H-dependent flavin oxidoreductase [uncultured Flavonifractor sp.]